VTSAVPNGYRPEAFVIGIKAVGPLEGETIAGRILEFDDKPNVHVVIDAYFRGVKVHKCGTRPPPNADIGSGPVHRAMQCHL
jgi:hypothetical protein